MCIFKISAQNFMNYQHFLEGMKFGVAKVNQPPKDYKKLLSVKILHYSASSQDYNITLS